MDGLFDIIVIGIFQVSLIYTFINETAEFSDIIDIYSNPLIILFIISIFFTPIQHLIYDRYSAYTRWIMEEQSLKIQPTLRREISFVFIDFINDTQLILLIILPFYLDIIVIYFLINLLASLYIVFLHLYFSKKYMSTYAENHRKKDLNRR